MAGYIVLVGVLESEEMMESGVVGASMPTSKCLKK
jgi:hypothetical protein